MKQIILLMGFILCFTAIKSQSLLTEVSAGYSVKPINSATFIMKVGVMSDDYDINNAHGIYCKMNYNLTRRADVPQMIGLHYLYNVNGIRLNVGGDYHIGSNDVINNPQTGWRLSYGISKYFNNKPWVISIDRSGKYTTISVGLFATI